MNLVILLSILNLCWLNFCWAGQSPARSFEVTRGERDSTALEVARVLIHRLALEKMHSELDALSIDWGSRARVVGSDRQLPYPYMPGLPIGPRIAEELGISEREAYLGVFYYLSRLEGTQRLVAWKWLQENLVWLQLDSIPRADTQANIERAIEEHAELLRGYFLSQSTLLEGANIFDGTLSGEDLERMAQLGIRTPDLVSLANTIRGRYRSFFVDRYREKYLALQRLVLPERHRGRWDAIFLNDKSIQEMGDLTDSEAALVDGFVNFLERNSIVFFLDLLSQQQPAND